MPRVKSPYKRPSKTIRNPLYDAWWRENQSESSGYPREDIFPEEYNKKLPDDGGWILLLMEVRVGERIDDNTVRHINVPRLSVWFALPSQSSNGRLYHAIIHTPEGDVHVYPHEYTLIEIEKFLEFTEEDGLIFHPLRPEGAFDEAALFYLRSRGISKGEAQRMLLPQLKDQNFCWFEFSDIFREIFPEGTGTPYLMPHNHTRRAEARIKKVGKNTP